MYSCSVVAVSPRPAECHIPDAKRALFAQFLGLSVEGIDQRTKLFDSRRRLLVLVVVEHTALAKIVPGTIEFLYQRILGSTNPLMNLPLPFPVQGSQGFRSLEHQVFEKMRRTELAGLLVQRHPCR